MPHDAWDTAREQLKQFRSVQDEVLKLEDGESFLGFAMNGATTRDGIALMHITRNENIFSYETRLVGGLSEGAAHDVLLKFTSNTASHISLKENTENPLFQAVKGQIQIDLKNQQQITDMVQDVLDARNEINIDTISSGMCRSKEVPVETNLKKIERNDSFFIKKRQEYAFGLIQKKHIDDVPYAYTQSNRNSIRRDSTVIPVRSGALFDNGKKLKQNTQTTEEISKKIYETEYLINNQEVRKIIYPEFSQVIVTDVTTQNKPQQKTEVIEIEKVFKSVKPERSVKHVQVEMPVATFVVPSEYQTVPCFVEKALVITVPAVKQLYVEQKAQTGIIVGEYQTISERRFKKIEQNIVKQPGISEEQDIQQIEKSFAETDRLIEVDQINIQDLHTFIRTFENEVKHGNVQGEVKKLVWMELNDQAEFIPVEELEIAQDSVKIIHTLLHFLRKIIRVYSGDDVIRERVIQRIASDKQTDTLEELEEYLALLQSRQFYGHMFALVN